MQVELYAKICSLSYMGDLRMLFAEDRDKVHNYKLTCLGCSKISATFNILNSIGLLYACLIIIML